MTRNDTDSPKYERQDDGFYGIAGSDAQDWICTDDLDWSLASMGRDLDPADPDFTAKLRAVFEAKEFFAWHPFHMMINDYGFEFFADTAAEIIRGTFRIAS